MRYLSLMLVVSFVWVSAASAQDAEKIYKKIQSLPAKQRQQALVEGAKKEGSLTLYAVFVRPVMEAFLKTFNEKYPFIQTQFIREGRGDALADRYLTEYRAGRYIADVLAGGDNAILSLLEAKVLASYESPERKFFPRDYKDKEGRWTTIFISEWAFGYNTRMIDRNKLPKSYLDLLDPYWKGKIGLDPLPNNFVRGARKAYGEKKALDFFQKLVETQDIQFRRGRTLQTQLLAAGEFAASPELRLSILKEMKQNGAPVDYHFAYPFPTTMAALSIFKSTRNPHAAALLVDFWLSKEGQQFLVDREFTVVREGMMQLDVEGVKNMVPLDLEFRAATDEWVRKITAEVFSKRARGR
jgi:iron(III) transport system substrate-binding protein